MLPVWSDFRHAARSLSKTPAFAAVAVASLALGIGANVTVFSVVREMILDDLSARRPDRLVRVEGPDVSYTVYHDLRMSGSLEDLAFYRGLRDRIWRAAGRNEMVWIFTTSPNFFDTLGVGAFAGRLYSQADEGRELAVASYGFWRKRLQSDPDALGRPVSLNGSLYTLVGILPPDYRGIYGHGVSPELYLSDAGTANPRDRLYGLFGRLRGGTSPEQTRQSLAATVDRLQGRDPLRRPVELRPMRGWQANAAKGGDDRLFFVFFAMLFVVAAMLTLIACSNVAGLLALRGMSRRREMAIRKSLGAGRLQMVRPLLVEGLVLVVCGAITGFALDAWLRQGLRHLRWPSAYGIPLEFHFQSDGGLMLYGVLTAFAALLIIFAIHALKGDDADLGLAMKQGEPSFSFRRWDLRNGFVVLQLALSIILLSLGGLFTRSLWHLVSAGPGFDIQHTLIAVIHPLPGAFPGDHEWDLRQRVLRRVEAVPGVTSVTSAGWLPLVGEVPDSILRKESDPLSPGRHVYAIGAGENYCTTLGIPILRGRDLQLTDREREPIPILVNLTLARQFFRDTDPIGQHLLLGKEKAVPVEIVGVAANSKMRSLGEADMPALFKPDFNGQLLVRVAGNASHWIEPVRNALAEADANAALDVRPLADAAAGALFPMRAASGFLISLSCLGLLMSMTGLYNSISYAVSRRTRELGICAALGASRPRIVWMALRDGVAVLAAGAGIGLPLAVLGIRPLVDLLPSGIDPWQPLPFLAIVSVLLATGLLAIWAPARRAARSDPALALRQE